MPQLTVSIAGPGTYLAEGGRSFPGHTWYTLTDNAGNTTSYGFAPIEHGSAWGQGQIYNNDNTNYLSTTYSKTIDISDAQFEKLQSFGENPAQYGFDTTYVGPTNSCIDFVWNALNKVNPDATGFEGTQFPDNPVNMAAVNDALAGISRGASDPTFGQTQASNQIGWGEWAFDKFANGLRIGWGLPFDAIKLGQSLAIAGWDKVKDWVAPKAEASELKGMSDAEREIAANQDRDEAERGADMRANAILNNITPAERELADAQDRDEAERGADMRANAILNNMTPAEREIADAQDRDEAERGADMRANAILNNMTPAEREIAANQDRDEAERGADMRELERANNLNRETTDPEMGREFIRNQLNLNMPPAEREILENMDREDAQLGDAMRANELLNGRSDAERAIEESQDRDDAELGAAMRDQQRTNELLDNLSPNERTILENQDREDADLGAAMRDSMRNNDNLDSLSPNEREILDNLDRDDAERGADLTNSNDGPSFVPADQRGDAGTDNALDAFNQTSYTPDATTDQLGTDATDWSGMWNSAAELNGSSFGENSADTAAEIAGVGSGSGSGIEPPSGDTAQDSSSLFTPNETNNEVFNDTGSGGSNYGGGFYGGGS